MAPEDRGTAAGLMNSVGWTGGFLAPVAVGYASKSYGLSVAIGSTAAQVQDTRALERVPDITLGEEFTLGGGAGAASACFWLGPREAWRTRSRTNLA